MATGKGDINFGFDASGFTQAVGKMSGSLKSLESNTKNMVGQIGKGVSGAMSKVGVVFELIKHGASAIVGAMKEFIPEIGTALGIAKGIIFKNLLYPLRMALLPILQKILDWVRLNRKLFVELGGVLVNAFKMVKSVLMSVLNMVSPIVDMIKKMLKSIFGDSVQSVADTLNMVMLKIMVFGMMVSNLLRPIFEGLSDIVTTVIDLIGSFFSGFSKGFGGINTAMDGMNSLKTILEGIATVVRTLIPLFEGLGRATGWTFKQIGNIVKFLQGKGVGDWGIRDDKDTFNTAPDSRINDGIVQKGKVISTNPNDTIIAMKNPRGLGGGGVTINVGGINVTATEGNAVSVGEGIVKGMERQIKNVLLNSLTLEGST